MMDADTKQEVLTRLKRVAGHLSGVERMVEEDRHCVDVLVQMAAVQAALGQAGRVVLGSHAEMCVATAIQTGSDEERKQTIDELLEVLNRYGRMDR